MKADILASLKTLLEDIADSKYEVRITIVDNSQNSDGIKEALHQHYPRVHYIASPTNIGFGKANNVGFTSCKARYYFCLNRDTLFPKGTHVVERLIGYMDSHPKIGCIGPKLVHMDGSLQYSCYRFDLSSMLIKPLKQMNIDKRWLWTKRSVDRLHMSDFDHESTRPVDWVLGAAMVVRQEVLSDVGMFDDRYFMYLEDADWCLRMWEAHWPVYYVHDIILKHRHERASAKIRGSITALYKNKLARIHLMSWMKFIHRWKRTFQYYEEKK